MSVLTSLYSPRNIMDRVDIDNLTIEQYLRLTQESQTPKKIEDMTIVEYLEYEKKVNENHISNSKSFLPTYFGKNMEEEVEYITDDEVVVSEQEESNHVYTQNIQHFKEKDDVDEWLNAEITKHISMQGVENMKDALISIIKSIRQEMKDGIMKRPFLESTRAQINVFNEESSFEIGSKKFKFNIDSYQSVEKIYMVKIRQEEEIFNPLEIGIELFSYESPACLQFEQITRSYGTPKPQDEIAGTNSLSPDRGGLVKR
ncbi:hypothetical protein Tco_0875750 [Tanacetum coccineum]|uniref:Uncharacterized protein n=1 Tax=Tanacetum coccineum TaxID=301880 RepID=A0ABQ5BS04_9ASTR